MLPDPPLPPAQDIALAYAPPAVRPAWAALLALDLRLAEVVAKVREPMLAQIRLAWWRETLGRSETDRPEGEPLLAEISAALPGLGPHLAQLPAAWEMLVVADDLSAVQLDEYLDLRAEAYTALATMVGEADVAGPAAQAARWWILGDTLSHLGRAGEREALMAIARADGSRVPALPAALRPLAVLGALGARAVRRDEPVFAGRISPLVALRVGIFGR